MIFKLANRVELFMAKQQEKGYGAGTLKKKLSMLKHLLKTSTQY